MIPWIIMALQNGPMERDALLTAVDVIANANGFKAKENMFGLKKALNKLSHKDNKENKVKNIRKGWWALADKIVVDEETSPSKLVAGKRSVDVLREIGKGTQSVYIFQYKEDVDQAKSKKHDCWNCKIGKSKNAENRVTGSSTFIVKSPQVGLLIRCDDSAVVEKILHWSLSKVGQGEKHDAGHEWFRTSPQLVETFYRSWLQACELLKREPY